MKIQDARVLEDGALIEADLAIVGSGPAGLSIAQQFAGGPVRVVVIESGGFSADAAASDLNEVENTGVWRKPNQWDVRNRIFGGSSHTWWGRCRSFDAIDYERRDWVANSGWPLTASDMEKYVALASRAMRIGPDAYDDRLWELLGIPPADAGVDRGLLHSCFWQFAHGRDDAMDFMRFGPEFLALEAPNVEVLTNATVTRIVTGEAGRNLTALQVRATPDTSITVRPKTAVLAAGGIENARLLLASEIGGDAVGRYLMDHPRTTIGEFTGKAARATMDRFGYFQLRHGGAAHFYVHGFALSPEVQRREGLLNCAAFPTEFRADDDPWDAIKRLITRTSASVPRDVLAAVKSPGLVLAGLSQRLLRGRNVTHKLDKLVFDCLIEQVPDPDSRVTLSDRTDRFGVPLPRVHWRISAQERLSAMRLGELLASELARAGGERMELPEWIRASQPEAATFIDVAHPTGTTRMADDPAEGAIDRNGQVHGVDGLYVAGSSVFPTAGHANPTLMIVAMALRLSEWLKASRFN